MEDPTSDSYIPKCTTKGCEARTYRLKCLGCAVQEDKTQEAIKKRIQKSNLIKIKIEKLKKELKNNEEIIKEFEEELK